MGEPDLQLLDRAVRHLAALDRPSASAGEREAAEWIASALREEGCTARVERERAHGTYWWPLGLLASLGALGAIAGLRGRRRVALAAGTVAAAAIADDVSGGRQWFRRALLPARDTHNVVAQTGDPDAEHTVLFVAHHDAAHWSLLFHPAVPAWIGDHHPALLEATDSTPPLMLPVVGGPALVALGGLTGRRALLAGGGLLSAATAAAMAEIGSRSTVPGANDNLSGVAALLGLARRLREEPVRGLRVMLVSTGSEESFMEGMQAFGRRHFATLAPERTHVVCLDTVGSPSLVQLEGEGMLRVRRYPALFKDLVSACAREAGVELRRGLTFRNATDGLIALRAGYPTVMIGSVNRYKVPDNYHWPTDDADHLDLGSVGDAVRLCEAVVRRLAATSGSSGAPARRSPGEL